MKMKDNPILIYAIAAFCLGAVVVWQRDSIPRRLRKPLALVSSLMILFAFALIVYSFFSAGA